MTKLIGILTCCTLYGLALVAMSGGCTADKETPTTSLETVRAMGSKTLNNAAIIQIDNGDDYLLGIASGYTITPTEITCSAVLFFGEHATVHNVSYARDQVTAFWTVEPGIWPPMPKGD